MAGARECRDRALDLAGVTRLYRAQLHAERRRHGLDGTHLAHLGGPRRVANDRHSGDAWRDFFEQLQPFPAEAIFDYGEPGRIATGARQACDEAGTDRINNLHEHNRYGAGDPLQGHYAAASGG